MAERRAAGPPSHRAISRIAGLVLPALGLLAIWTVAALSGAGRVAIPSPAAVLLQMYRDGGSFYLPALGATLGRAAGGFVCGNALAFLLASLATLWPALHRPVVQLGTVSASIPVIVLGPLLAIVFGAEVTTVALAGIAVFFNSLVALLAGFAATGRSADDLFQAYGAGRRQRYLRLQLLTCLPHAATALGIAAPAAILGAILGEWLGGAQSGLGVALVIAMQQMNVARSWGIALVCGAVAASGYGLIARMGRLATPWAHGR